MTESPDISIETFTARLDAFKEALGRVVVGQTEVIEGVLTSLIAGGHVLLEGVPGLGKTLTARAVAKLVDCEMKRIQFTPDLMPSDVTGGHVFNMKTHDFDFHPGPVFTNVLLADEINRAPAKTHSALLEVMQERRVSIDRTTYDLDWPFFTMATQNPIESEGTYVLPAAQLDRFMFKLMIGYLTEGQEEEVLRRSTTPGNRPEEVVEQLTPVLDRDALRQLAGLADRVTVEPAVLRYANQLVRATRTWHDVLHGGSTRAGITIMRGARVQALLAGRDFVVPDDVQALFLPALRHRVILSPEAEVEGSDVDQVLGQIRDSVEVPRAD